MNVYCEVIRSVVAGGGAGPLLTHADVLRSRAAIMPIADPKAILPGHITALEFIAKGRPLLFPSFNYEYLRSRIYRPAEDRSQVGPLTEHARRHWAEWRFGAPVFNVVGRGPLPDGVREDGEVDPFGGESVFAYLHRAGGDVLLYGTTLASLTAIHYVERLSGGPLYRYDKVFPGTIQTDVAEREVRLVYHCRPMGKSLDYDFPRLAAEAEQAGVLVRLRGPGSEVGFVRFGALCEFWLERLGRDPLYLLDSASREWVAPNLERLGRRFELADFE
jgi:aminoglycoside 3-N-acetyltransferase